MENKNKNLQSIFNTLRNEVSSATESIRRLEEKQVTSGIFGFFAVTATPVAKRLEEFQEAAPITLLPKFKKAIQI